MGCLHPDFLLEQLTSRQLAEWRAYFTGHAFGQDYTDRLVAEGLAMFANVHRKQGSPEAKAEDWLPQKQQTPEEMQAVLRSVLRGRRKVN